jgi:mycothiol synthase
MSSPAVVAVPPSGFAALRGTAERIDATVMQRTGHPALGAAVWRDFAQPGTDSLGVVVGSDAFVHVARSDTFSPQHWTIGLALGSESRDEPTVTALVDAAAVHIAARGGGRAVCWVFAADERDDELLTVAGLTPTRGLYEMRAPLPRPEPIQWPRGVSVRDFVPGHDDAAWLEVNNRAFRNHPDQGDWIESTLARRMAEPWFDPSIFVLAFDEDGLAGFNWCKVHPATDRQPALGEIFVIGIDPRMAGTGLGRPLALEGLGRLAQRGLRTAALFTAADNERALKLYRSIGFTEHRVDRAYERDVAPASR